MDNITKFLLKLSSKERLDILGILEKILNLDLELLDIKKLKNNSNLFRVRKGKIRIIFSKKDGKGLVMNIDYRNKAYNNL